MCSRELKQQFTLRQIGTHSITKLLPLQRWIPSEIFELMVAGSAFFTVCIVPAGADRTHRSAAVGGGHPGGAAASGARHSHFGRRVLRDGSAGAESLPAIYCTTSSSLTLNLTLA